MLITYDARSRPINVIETARLIVIFRRRIYINTTKTVVSQTDLKMRKLTPNVYKI